MYLCKDSKSVVDSSHLSLIWDKLQFEFIETFGVSESFQKIMECKRMIEIYKAEMLIDGDKSLQTFIDIEVSKIEKITSRYESSAKSNEIKAYLESKLHFRIDEKAVTVKEFYSWLKVTTNGKG